MTGYRSRHFRWKCEDKGCYHEQLPEWDDLIECFPGRIMPTDIDGMVELNGHFLFLEQKSPDKGIEHGQGMALRGLCKMPGVTAVIFRPAVMTDLECLVYGAEGALLPGWEPYDGFKPHSREEFRTWLREWSGRASKETRTT
jgi:hypothetical protein